MKTIWVKSNDGTLADLGFKATKPNETRKVNGTFSMVDGYGVPETDITDVVALLVDCNVPHEVE